MSKYVYLFELDSVRKTDQEIEIGQQMLYDEIVANGNVVVLTYNQLVDSRGFFSLRNLLLQFAFISFSFPRLFFSAKQYRKTAHAA